MEIVNPNILMGMRPQFKRLGELFIHSPIRLPILTPKMASIQEVMGKGPHDSIGKSLIIIPHLQIGELDQGHGVFGVIDWDADPGRDLPCFPPREPGPPALTHNLVQDGDQPANGFLAGKLPEFSLQLIRGTIGNDREAGILLKCDVFHG